MYAEWRTDEDTGERRLGTMTTPAGVFVLHGNMNARALTGDSDFQPGDYRCRAELDGVELGGHSFTVG